MRNRIFRLLVCLVLVCVILVNCSPIRARAVEPVTMVMVSAATVIASVMIGIGVMMGQNQEAFDQVVQMVQGSNALKDFIQQDETKGEVIPLYRSPGTGGVGSGALSLLVAGALIEAIRQVLFANDVISSDSSFPSLPGDYSQYIVYKGASSGTIYCYCGDAVKKYVEPPLPDGDKSVCFLSPFWAYTLQSGSWVEYDNGVSISIYASSLAGGYPIWSSFDIFTDSSMTQIFFNGSSKSSFGISTSVLDGLVPGEIAPQEQELSEGYADWVSGSQWDVNNSQWWPVAVAPTYDETVNFSQEQVQKGEGTITDADLEDNSDSEQDPDSDQVTASSLKGWLDGIKDRMTLLLQPLALTVSNILDVVTGIPEALLNGIQRLFIPDAESMAAQQDKWTKLLSDRFGAVYDSVALIDNIAGAFTLGATQTQIRFPLITIPFADVTWEFGGWMVDVVPDGFQVLVDALKVGIDILCTLAFVNAMKHRMERVLEGRG